MYKLLEFDRKRSRIQRVYKEFSFRNMVLLGVWIDASKILRSIGYEISEQHKKSRLERKVSCRRNRAVKKAIENKRVGYKRFAKNRSVRNKC